MNFPIPNDLNFQKYCIDKYGSFEKLIDKAKSGEIHAQADLGWAYSQGFGDLLPQDNDKAIGWLSTAVDKGYELPNTLGKLGELLDRKGTIRHQQKAYEMYHRAAKLGCRSSQLNLAEMYRCGVEGVVNEDLKEAFKWYKMAGDESASDYELGSTVQKLVAGTMKKLGNDSKLRSLKCLYKYYLEGECPEGRPQPTKAIHYLTRAAEIGDTEAQRNLGQIYLSGSCEQIKDVLKARRWLKKASANGDAVAKQLLRKCEEVEDKQHTASEPKTEALAQSLEIMDEKLRQRSEAKKHPFAITEPTAFSEEMLSEFHWSPTARIYLHAFRLVNQGLAILLKSNFTDERGITLIARGYLTENSILQAFPYIHVSLPKVFHLCEKSMQNNPSFFEGLVVTFGLHFYEMKLSVKTQKTDEKKVMCITNLINFIQKAEPNSLPPEDAFRFDQNYSSWLHVLYDHLASLYVIYDNYEAAAEAFENSLKCCPTYFPSKRGLGYCLLALYSARVSSEKKDSAAASEKCKHFQSEEQIAEERKISKYRSWTTEELGDAARKRLEEFLAEAPSCWKTYPNVCYYLAKLALVKSDMKELKRYYEQGQDAEEKRLPFLSRVDIPLKDLLSPIYQLLADLPEQARCGNKACTKKVNETELKSCAGCRTKKYCSKVCQRADWKEHKSACTAFKQDKTNANST